MSKKRYAVVEIPAGALGGRSGQRTVLTRIVLWWSAFTALTASVSNFWTLLLVHFLFGYLVRHYGNYNAPLFAIATMLMVGAWVCSRIDSSKPIVREEAPVVHVS